MDICSEVICLGREYKLDIDVDRGPPIVFSMDFEPFRLTDDVGQDYLFPGGKLNVKYTGGPSHPYINGEYFHPMVWDQNVIYVQNSYSSKTPHERIIVDHMRKGLFILRNPFNLDVTINRSDLRADRYKHLRI